jgi:hypothetical protein
MRSTRDITAAERATSGETKRKQRKEQGEENPVRSSGGKIDHVACCVDARKDAGGSCGGESCHVRLSTDNVYNY